MHTFVTAILLLQTVDCVLFNFVLSFGSTYLPYMVRLICDCISQWSALHILSSLPGLLRWGLGFGRERSACISMETKGKYELLVTTTRWKLSLWCNQRYLCFGRHCSVAICRSCITRIFLKIFSNSWREYWMKFWFRCVSVLQKCTNGSTDGLSMTVRGGNAVD